MAKTTNLDKWNSIKAVLYERLFDFVTSLGKEIPEKFYMVHPSGSLAECFPVGISYRYEFPTYFSGKSPTKKEITQLYLDSQQEIQFSVDKIHIDYYYLYGADQSKAHTAIKFKDLFPLAKNIFTSKEEAELYAVVILETIAANRLFDETHKKDKHYDYRKNGYKDLGWQNGWKHVYFDEDGKQTTSDLSKGEKPKKSFGYTKEDYPEHGNCLELNHRRITVQHDNRGTQNDVSCPICKIVWHYDCSD